MDGNHSRGEAWGELNGGAQHGGGEEVRSPWAVWATTPLLSRDECNEWVRRAEKLELETGDFIFAGGEWGLSRLHTGARRHSATKLMEDSNFSALMEHRLKGQVPEELAGGRKYGGVTASSFLVSKYEPNLSTVPLRAQRVGLDRVRRGEAGGAANLLVRLYYNEKYSLDAAREAPSHFDTADDDDDRGLDEQIASAMEEAMSQTSFKPNASQQEAVRWALKRRIGMIRGPPGTGKTRCSALLISTALKMRIKHIIGRREVFCPTL